MSEREVVLDVETTGLSANGGDRIIEVGAVELNGKIPTGKEYHVFVNPERPVPPEAQRIHGITDEMLSGQPVFAEIAEAFSHFIGTDPLVIHNAEFDLGFLNSELQRLVPPRQIANPCVDTLLLARSRHPGKFNSLDVLCRRYNIDMSTRSKHGALTDARLLAQVYLELTGGRQRGFSFATVAPSATSRGKTPARMQQRENHDRGRVGTRKAGGAAGRTSSAAPQSRISAVEAQAHAEFVAGLPDGALWKNDPAFRDVQRSFVVTKPAHPKDGR